MTGYFVKKDRPILVGLFYFASLEKLYTSATGILFEELS